VGGCSGVTTLAKQKFNKYGEPMPTIQTDKSLFWSVAKGEGRFTGVSTDVRWEGNHVILPIEGDSRAFLELSGEFMIKRSLGYQLVALWGMRGEKTMNTTRGPLGLCFEGKEGKGDYKSITRWLEIPASPSVSMAGFGDETSVFHEMRILLDREKSRIEYFVDEKKVGAITYKGEIPAITKLQMGVETPDAGTMLDIRFDNLSARSWGDTFEFGR